MNVTLTITCIKQTLQDCFETSQNIKTTLSNVIKLVTEKFPEPSEEDIKTALANMEGWSIKPTDLPDQIEITPAFFSE